MSPFFSGALGAAVVLLLAGLVRRAAWRHRFRRGGRGGPWFLQRLFRRLGTRPEQEKVVSAEASALAGELRALREDGRALRAEVAELLAGPALDAQAVSRALDGRMAKLQALRDRISEALARVHAVLDPHQRAELATLLARGPHGRHGRHPRWA
jgi:Spy/CpxP family protein refolding chaperone